MVGYSTYLSTLPTYLPTYIPYPTYLPSLAYLPTYLPTYLSTCLHTGITTAFPAKAAEGLLPLLLWPKKEKTKEDKKKTTASPWPSDS